MQKVSSSDAAALLKTAGATIRTLVEKNAELQQELNDRTHHERVVKIAQQMEEKGLDSDKDLNQKIAGLKKAKNLDATEEAIKMAAPQGNFFGNPDDAVPGGGADPFVHFIQTGEDIRGS